MKNYFNLSFLALVFSLGCDKPTTNSESEKWKAEIMQIEQNFNDLAQEKGLVEAFHYYAAKDGVIKRNRKIVKGKAAIKAWYEKDIRPNETLTWKPTFVDVSQAGDLAYTYGDYIFTSIDSTGTKKESTGIFHTVWKRQEDGSWKFVWD